MILPPKSNEYKDEWGEILRRAYIYTSKIAVDNWPYRLRKDDVLDAVLTEFKVPESIDMDSDEVRTLSAHSWGYYCKWHRELFHQQGQQLKIFD